MYIKLTHNMEVAHRLLNMPGKCQQIHGHSMQVELTLHGDANEDGVFEGLDFGDVKKVFRAYIDKHFDHKLLLNEDDPWARTLVMMDDDGNLSGREPSRLPGLVKVDGDPTTENLARWIHEWAAETWGLRTTVYIQETGTNGVGYYG